MKTQLTANEHAIHEDYLSLRQAAKVLEVNRNWLSAYLKGRGVKLIRIGPSLVIRRGEVEAIKLELPAKEVKAS